MGTETRMEQCGARPMRGGVSLGGTHLHQHHLKCWGVGVQVCVYVCTPSHVPRPWAPTPSSSKAQSVKAPT